MLTSYATLTEEREMERGFLQLQAREREEDMEKVKEIKLQDEQMLVYTCQQLSEAVETLEKEMEQLTLTLAQERERERERRAREQANEWELAEYIEFLTASMSAAACDLEILTHDSNEVSTSLKCCHTITDHLLTLIETSTARVAELEWERAQGLERRLIQVERERERERTMDSCVEGLGDNVEWLQAQLDMAAQAVEEYKRASRREADEGDVMLEAISRRWWNASQDLEVLLQQREIVERDSESGYRDLWRSVGCLESIITKATAVKEGQRLEERTREEERERARDAREREQEEHLAEERARVVTLERECDRQRQLHAEAHDFSAILLKSLSDAIDPVSDALEQNIDVILLQLTAAVEVAHAARERETRREKEGQREMAVERDKFVESQKELERVRALMKIKLEAATKSLRVVESDKMTEFLTQQRQQMEFDRLVLNLSSTVDSLNNQISTSALMCSRLQRHEEQMDAEGASILGRVESDIHELHSQLRQVACMLEHKQAQEDQARDAAEREQEVAEEFKRELSRQELERSRAYEEGLVQMLYDKKLETSVLSQVLAIVAAAEL